MNEQEVKAKITELKGITVEDSSNKLVVAFMKGDYEIQVAIPTHGELAITWKGVSPFTAKTHTQFIDMNSCKERSTEFAALFKKGK